MTASFPSQILVPVDRLFPVMPRCLRILVVEHVPTLSARLRTLLRRDRHCVDQVQDEELARERAREGGYDVLVLALPAQESMALCGSLRREGSGIPILLLRDSAAVKDVVAGLNAGADDYLAGPLDLLELAARLRALARRHRLNRRLAAQQAG